MDFVVVVTSVHGARPDLFGPFESKELASQFVTALAKASTPDFEYNIQRLRQPDEVL